MRETPVGCLDTNKLYAVKCQVYDLYIVNKGFCFTSDPGVFEDFSVLHVLDHSLLDPVKLFASRITYQGSAYLNSKWPLKFNKRNAYLIIFPQNDARATLVIVSL